MPIRGAQGLAAARLGGGDGLEVIRKSKRAYKLSWRKIDSLQLI